MFAFNLPQGVSPPGWYTEKMIVLVALVETPLSPLFKNDGAEAERTVKVLWAGIHGICQQYRLMKVLPITITIILLQLYLSFRRFAEVALIMGRLPLAPIGGFWLLYLLGYNFSVAVMVGFVAFAGFAVEIGVLMLVYLNQTFADI